MSIRLKGQIDVSPPQYNSRAAVAIGYLKRQKNDLEVYVEDTTCRNMWNYLIKATLPHGVKFDSVNMLGGRTKVEDACKLASKINDGRRRVYIIDGDFDHLLARRPKTYRGLIRLDAYCIENILLRPYPITELCKTFAANDSEQSIKTRIDFDKWMQVESKKLVPLFALYAVIMKLENSIPNVGLPVNALYAETSEGVTIDEKKVRCRMRGLTKMLLKRVPASEVRHRYNIVHERAKHIAFSRCISGKDYLLPILAIRLRKLFSCNYRIDELKVAMARNWQPNKSDIL